MNTWFKCFILPLFFLTYKCYAQLQIPANIELAYKKGTRSPDGKPGKSYWQNSADYTIRVRFSPDSILMSGEVDINYMNNSPDSLNELWFNLYPNLYKAGSARDSKISASDISDGVSIDSIWINGNVIDPATIRIDATNMIMDHISLPNGQSLQCRIVYHYIVNKTSHIRTGEIEPNADFIAYFFPRIAVYDDI